jgi:hypothetical protein
MYIIAMYIDGKMKSTKNCFKIGGGRKERAMGGEPDQSTIYVL